MVVQAPDNNAAAASVLASAAAGAVKDIKTTVMMTVEEAMEAMRKVPSAVYRLPGG